MTIIGLKELSQNAGKIAERVQKGERFTVVKRSRPVFTIGPPVTEAADDIEAWTEQFIKDNEELLISLADK